ncbi:Rdx family-domain-containing protein [Bombardia bombarda]|uniref:Rdx family-domain-containing protein n=1 Tax=Bombardia bombarda TaxID=252184 RepID=A0AA39WT68_9PEZI|nr:Rdx family-domain-containing protein [Bombardia bombarda]
MAGNPGPGLADGIISPISHPMSSSSESSFGTFPLPRVTIRFCTQCKWLLRAAYFAQELLSTFSTSLGEVALQPATGGAFTVEITYEAPQQQQTPSSTEGGFPETKELKRRVRDVIQPGRDLGHVDRNYGKAAGGTAEVTGPQRQEKEENEKDAATTSTMTTTSTVPASCSVKEGGGGGGGAEGGKCEDCN